MSDNWKPEPGREPAIFYQLQVGDYCDLEIMRLENGRFSLSRGGNGIGAAETLEAAKRLALTWLLGQVGEMLKAAGAEGVWLGRGAKLVGFGYITGGPANGMWLELPHELVFLARFPVGDGGEPGIENL